MLNRNVVAQALIAFSLAGILGMPVTAEQLYIRNKPFKGATLKNGKTIWVELKGFAEAVDAKLQQNEQGGYLLSKEAAEANETPAGKVTVGKDLVETQEADGKIYISLDESAKLLGLRVVNNRDLGTIDVSSAPPAQSKGAGKGVVASDSGKPLAPIALNSPGAAVNIESGLVAGRVNIVDFYADWCGPCKQLAPKLEALVQKNPRYALLKVNIRDWKSPVAQQFKLTSIPHLKIYDEKGKLVAEGQAAYGYLNSALKGR